MIGATLAAIHAAAAPLARPYEVIVVDDASTDRTGAIAAEHSARVVWVNVRHIAAVRNAGAAVANGDMFIFVDADTVVNADVVAAAVRAIENGAAGGGAVVLWHGFMPVWARILSWVVLVSMRTLKWAAGCFIFASREAFTAAGGFDEGVYASEEVWLSRALKRQGRFVVLRESVVTSGRKLRTHSPMSLVRLTGAFFIRGVGIVRDRKYLELWYGERRHDE